MSNSTDTARDGRTDGDHALVDRFHDGDQEAFLTFYRRHLDAVFAYARRLATDAHGAEEICQDTFVVAWTKLTSALLVGDSALPWLLVTCRNKALSANRGTARRRARLADDADVADLSSAAANLSAPSVEEQVILRTATRQLNAAVAQLSAVDRTLYSLCIDGDATYEEAARELGVEHGVVRNRLSRLRKRLRDGVT